VGEKKRGAGERKMRAVAAADISAH